MPVDPRVQELLDAMAAAGVPKVGSISVAALRELTRSLSARALHGPELCSVKDCTVPAANRAIAVKKYLPCEQPSALMVYYHGGGWTVGTLEDYDAVLRKLTTRTNCAIISVDYRLAPEHPFPAAVDDAYAALCWAANNMEGIAGKTVPVIVAGDSAGGNLAAVVSQLARDAAGPIVSAQVLVYPSVAGDIDSESMRKFEPPFLTRDEIAWFFDQYIPEKTQRRDPRFAPLYADDLRNLPPAFVLTAEYDLLCAEGEQYAQRLSQANVPTRVKRYDGTIHGFLTMDGGLQHSVSAMEDIADFVTMIVQASPAPTAWQ
ncbi:acetyl esterase [Trinickia symbiotica]|uniref:Alpha/beta hydrolase n=1 Tax=Trinickia symbiotica TaxID=863227 RepID=A0A2N7X923_9BURK|nr:alpha/beta hydrolase [Trinickia symbiotica]PMS38228.1 alpha/beta hydrolase [Trinickia symbiotica]PPK47070.1 acetyl esterase [Trinickia symbiotica]